LTFYERQPDSLSRNVAAMVAAEITVLEPILAQPLSATQRRSLKKRLARAYFDSSYAMRERDAPEAVALAWRSLRTDPRADRVKRLVASLLAAAKGRLNV
jgi:hypothetical protein